MAAEEKRILDTLKALAPLSLAEEWDNVGLLVEARSPQREIHRVLLTIDLTPAVWKEAQSLGAELIVAYHPPIFGGLKKLRASAPGESILVGAIERGVNIYSPHTALDAAAGGVGDWLVQCLGVPATSVPITPNSEDPAVGAGRLADLSEAASLSALLPSLKKSLGLEHLRVATTRVPGKRFIRRVALCPGAGGSMFASLRDVDLYLTGEMRHHDVLGKVRGGAAVVLTEHTNCERGYLKGLAEKLGNAVQGVEILTSEADRDPLQIL